MSPSCTALASRPRSLSCAKTIRQASTASLSPWIMAKMLRVIALVDAEHHQRRLAIDGGPPHVEEGPVDVQVLEAAPRQRPVEELLGRRHQRLERATDLGVRDLHADDLRAQVREHPRREPRQVQQRQVPLDRLVVVPLGGHDVAVETTDTITRNAKLDRAQPLDAERARDVPVALVATLARLPEEQTDLRLHHLLQRVAHALADLLDHLAQRFTWRRLEAAGKRHRVANLHDHLHQRFSESHLLPPFLPGSEGAQTRTQHAPVRPAVDLQCRSIDVEGGQRRLVRAALDGGHGLHQRLLELVVCRRATRGATLHLGLHELHDCRHRTPPASAIVAGNSTNSFVLIIEALPHGGPPSRARKNLASG